MNDTVADWLKLSREELDARRDELYDLATDPFERRNLARERPDLVASLKAELGRTPPYWTPLVPVRLSEESLEQLRQLGYIR